MRKKWTGIAGLLLAGLFAFGGCGKSGTALPHDNQIHPEFDRAYASELFYRNDLGTGGFFKISRMAIS